MTRSVVITRGNNLAEGKPSFPYEGKGFRRKALHRNNSEHTSRKQRLKYWPVGRWAGGSIYEKAKAKSKR